MLAESGTHDELMALGGYYAALFREQVEKAWTGSKIKWKRTAWISPNFNFILHRMRALVYDTNHSKPKVYKNNSFVIQFAVLKSNINGIKLNR
jgi:hypothetical protein